MGLILLNNIQYGNRLQLKNCATSTPSARIPKWRSTLRDAFLTAVDNEKVNSSQDVEKVVMKARKSGTKIVTLHFDTMHKHAMHPQEGIPLIYHD